MVSEGEGQWYPEADEDEPGEPEYVFQCQYCGNIVPLSSPKIVTGYRSDHLLDNGTVLVIPFTFCGEHCARMGTRWVPIGR